MSCPYRPKDSHPDVTYIISIYTYVGHYSEFTANSSKRRVIELDRLSTEKFVSTCFKRCYFGLLFREHVNDEKQACGRGSTEGECG